MSLQVTILGLVFGPITLLLAIFRRNLLLPWIAFLGMFEASSVLDIAIGGYVFGVQPGYLAAAAFVVCELFVRRPRADGVTRVLRPAYLLCLYAVLGAIVLPLVFGGAVEVYSSRVSLPGGDLVPLGYSATNASQVLYLAFLVMFCAFAARRVNTRGAWWRIADWLLAGACVSAAIGFLGVYGGGAAAQLVHSVINSDPSTAQLFGENVAGLGRISGTFREPSVAAQYYTAALAIAAWRFMRRPKLGIGLLALFLFTTVVLTGSSTAYLTVGFVILAVGWLTFVGAQGTLMSAMWMMFAVSAALAVVLLLMMGVIAPGYLLDTLGKVLPSVTVGKLETASAATRFAEDGNALQDFWQTYGLGVGWGSERASSLVTTLLANVGAIGMMILLSFALRVRRAARGVGMGDASLFLLTTLLAGAIAVSDTTNILLWLVVGCVVGVGARSSAKRRVSVPAEAPTPPPSRARATAGAPISAVAIERDIPAP